MTIKKNIARGSFWTVGSAAINQGVQFITFALLARILNPSDIGLMAIALVIIGIGRLILDFGLGMAIIQDNELNMIKLNTVFWFSSGVSLILYTLITLSAESISQFLNNTDIKNIIHLSNLVFFIEAIRIVPNSLLRKELEFKKLAYVSLTNAFVYSVIALILAFNGYGVYSLLYAYLISAFTSTVITVMFKRWFPKLLFSLKEAKGLLKFGSNMTLSSLLGYINDNMERVLLAKYLGVFELGIYHFSKRIITLPQMLISQNVGVATYPVFSKIKSNNEELRFTYYFLLKSLSLLAFPVLTFIAFTSEIWINIFFGNKWDGANLPIKILSLTGMFAATVSPLGNVYLAKGKSYYNVIINSSIFLAVIIIYPLTSQVSFFTLCFGVVSVSFIGFVLNLYFSSKEIEATFMNNLKCMLPAFSFALFLIAILYILKVFMKGLISNIFIEGVIYSLIFSLTYSFLVFKLNRTDFKKVFELIKTRFKH